MARKSESGTATRREPVRYSFEIHSSAHSALPVCKAGSEAFGLFVVCALMRDAADDPTYVSRQRAASLGREPALPRVAARLVDADLWRPEGDGWRMVPRPRGFYLPEPLWRMRPVYERDPILDALRAAVYERDGNACLRCGATDDLTLDHIYPWSKGGPDSYSNLQTLCRPCNSSKGAKV
jgi:hypothetical protein